MAYRFVLILCLLAWGACADEAGDPVGPQGLLPDVPVDVPEGDVGGGDTAEPPVEDIVEPPMEDTVEPPVEDTTGPEVQDTTEPPVEDTTGPEVQDAAGPEVEDTSVQDTGPPPCAEDTDCDDGDPCTEDSCFANGLCFHDLVPGCCHLDEDCEQPASTCEVAVCEAFVCVTDTSACTGDEVVTVETFAGTGAQGHVDGLASEAMFYDPFGFDVDDQGKLYVVEIFGATVRLVAGGEVLTVAGGGLTPEGKSDISAVPSGFWGYEDGPALDALFNLPMHVAVESATGDLFVADGGNHMVRKVSNGQVSTLTGQGILTVPVGAVCTTDADCAPLKNCQILPSDATGTCDTTLGGFLDGPVEEALFSFPIATLLGDGGDLYVTDGNDRIRVIADGQVTTLSGAMGSGFADGPVETAMFDDITDMAWGPDGSLYVADNLNHRIRRIQDGMVTTVAGTGLLGCPANTNASKGCHADGPVAEASLSGPTGVTVAADGTLYVSEQSGHRIVRIANGMVTTLAGTGEAGFADGPGETAQFNLPTFLELGPDGSLYVSDRLNQRIRRVLMQ